MKYLVTLKVQDGEYEEWEYAIIDKADKMSDKILIACLYDVGNKEDDWYWVRGDTVGVSVYSRQKMTEKEVEVFDKFGVG